MHARVGEKKKHAANDHCKKEKKKDKSRSTAARKLNLLLLPIDKFQLLKMHPHSWLSFVVP